MAVGFPAPNSIVRVRSQSTLFNSGRTMSQEIISMMRNTTPGYHPGWGGPEYTSWQDEQMSWKRTCYIGDWSFLMDVEVTGEDALKFFQDTGINGFARFEIGQAKHLVQ